MLTNSSNPPLEEYELASFFSQVDLYDIGQGNRNSGDPRTPLETSHFSNEGRNSMESTSSYLFESIHDHARTTDVDQSDTFLNSPTFQNAIALYGKKTRSEKSIYIILGCFMATVWLFGLIVYASVSSNQRKQLAIEFNGIKPTLNSYKESLDKISMANFRQGIYFSDFEPILWLTEDQFQSQESEIGYYMTLNRNNSFVVKDTQGVTQNIVIDDREFSYDGAKFFVQKIILNPSKSVNDPAGSSHIVVTNIEKEWRHSTFGNYWLYDSSRRTYEPLRPPFSKSGSETQLFKLHFAEFSPKGNYITFGFEHDLFVITLDSSKILKITEDGSENTFNGKPDWVYEEEVSSNDRLFWWSPEENHLVFAKIDDSNVQTYTVDYYASESGDVSQYPTKNVIKYPKPGTNNPKLSLHAFKVSQESSYEIICSTVSIGQDFILYEALWIDELSFLIKLSDRTSKLLSKQVIDLSKSSHTNEICFSNATEEYGGWIGKQPKIKVIPVSGEKGRSSYIDRIVVDGNNHLALFDDAASKNYSRILTRSDKWGILDSSSIFFNKEDKYVYALTSMRSSMDSHLIGISLKSGEIKPVTGLNEDGKYEANFSPDGDFVDLRYTGPKQPWQKILNVKRINSHLNSDIYTVQKGADSIIKKESYFNDYEGTSELLEDVNLPTRVYSESPVGGDTNLKLNYKVILPPNFNPTKKYPLIVNAYGGPGSQVVDKSFRLGYEDIFSSNLNAIALIIDPRGTGCKDWRFKSYASNRIGYWEPRDITFTTSNFIKNHSSFVDEEKVGIWGWSYGGFTTLKTLEHDSGRTFKYGIAVAPVTNWMFYDSIYTERYMNLPSQNINYRLDAQISQFKNFKNVSRFLIIHGSSDENVHIQNSMWLLDKFNLNDVQNYDVHIFPDNDHSISSHNADSILLSKLLFWMQNAFSETYAKGAYS